MKPGRMHQKWKRLRARRDNPETTKHYTEQDIKSLAGNRPTGNGAGIIRPDDSVQIPASIDDMGEMQQTSHPNKVLFVIVTLALTFIAIIAYLVSQMPPRN
jgi:hypothetical protein